MGTFRAFLEEEYPGAQISKLSGSNNVVYKVQTTDEITIAKHVIDTDIPLGYLAEANACLAEHVAVQPITRVCETRRGDPFDAVFATYVEGRDLASVLAGGQGMPDTGDLVKHLCEFSLACRRLPRMHSRFGLYKSDAPVIGDHCEFVMHYASRYWSRARPFYEGTPVGTAVDDWLSGGFASMAERNPGPFTTVAIDANLKNFIVTPGGGLVVLNVPIAGLSTPAHAVGAISAHLRNREQHAPFLTAAAREVCPDDAAMVPHFELWALLGILSFYAVREPENRGKWRNWGAPVTLDEDFQALVRDHLVKTVRR